MSTYGSLEDMPNNLSLIGKYPLLVYILVFMHSKIYFIYRYFRYDRWSLPIAYNAIGHLLKDNMVTYAGTAPIIVHYTKYKPFRTEVEKYKEHYFAICNSSSN
jgi:hypothetical protein